MRAFSTGIMSRTIPLTLIFWSYPASAIALAAVDRERWPTVTLTAATTLKRVRDFGTVCEVTIHLKRVIGPAE